MTREETTKILAVLRAAYPSFYKDFDRDDLVAIVNLWHSVFVADDYAAVSGAVKALIATRTTTYPPVIGEIKAKLSDLFSAGCLTELEAWGLVSKAISNGYYGYKEEYAKLPVAVQRAIGRPEQLREWAVMDVETTQSVVASNFMRAYKVATKREKETAMLPPDVQKMLSPFCSNTAFLEGGTE